MNSENSQRPGTGMFIAAAMLICGLLSAVDGGNAAMDTVTGCVLLGGGGWATWKVGQWLWWRYAPRSAGEMNR